MKFVCLGYFDESAWEALLAVDQQGFMEACLAYDDELQRGGHWAGGEALQSYRNAATLNIRNGQVIVTDGPFAETKEQIGGIMYLEARDLNHAIALISKHPGLRVGPFEIRPVDEEFGRMIAERKAAK